MANQRLRANSGLDDKPADSEFGREVKRFARQRGFTSLTGLMKAVGASSEANVVRHLRSSKRGPQRAIVQQYADALRVPSEYLLALTRYVDANMVDDAKRLFDAALTALWPHLRSDRAEECWRRICARDKYAPLAAGVYIGVWRDRAERDCGLREYPRPEVVVLLEALHSMRFPLQQFVQTPDPSEMVFNLCVQLRHVIPGGLVEQTRAFAMDLYEHLGVNLKHFELERQAYERNPEAWLRSYRV